MILGKSKDTSNKEVLLKYSEIMDMNLERKVVRSSHQGY